MSAVIAFSSCVGHFIFQLVTNKLCYRSLKDDATSYSLTTTHYYPDISLIMVS